MGVWNPTTGALRGSRATSFLQGTLRKQWLFISFSLAPY